MMKKLRSLRESGRRTSRLRGFEASRPNYLIDTIATRKQAGQIEGEKAGRGREGRRMKDGKASGRKSLGGNMKEKMGIRC